MCNEFKKIGEQSEIWIVVAIESLDLGVDLPDVLRIMQYSFPINKDLAVLWQRFGCAARDVKLSGEAVFLVEPWAFGSRDSVDDFASPPSLYSESTLPPVSQTILVDNSASDSSSEEGVVEEEVTEPTIQRKNNIKRCNGLKDAVYNLLNSKWCI